MRTPIPNVGLLPGGSGRKYIPVPMGEDYVRTLWRVLNIVPHSGFYFLSSNFERVLSEVC